jgi:asparagine synthase (glutamine-hydrolysing)
MCGISGIYAFTETGRRALGGAEAANRTLEKRGPDSGKVVRGTHTALGHRRLSIIDVSCAGDQPMTTGDGRITIVFNGEIFNYKELKSLLLEEERAALTSASDTEVFLLLYARLREAVFPLLRGFFAAAIYDKQEDRLVLVRDRFGKKPLLFYRDGDRLCFASEMKALLAMGIPKRLAWNLLPVYLQLNYVPQPHSLIENVQKLQPGCFLTVTSKGVQLNEYYTLRLQPQKYAALGYEAAQEKLVQLMDEAVQLRLIADVPLGAFLSGGVDSSVVVALAAQHTRGLKTFSIGYKDHPFFDETYYANLVAKKWGTDHTVFSLGNRDFLEHVHGVLDYIDEPFADSSAIPVYILSMYTRQHVTVALSGDGGDEVFAGYNKHAAEWRMRNGGLLNTVVKAAYPVLSLLPKSRNNKITNTFRQLHRFAQGARSSAADRYWQWASFTTPQQAMALLHGTVQKKVSAAQLVSLRSGYLGAIKGTDFNEVLLADMNLVLLSDMLVKVDLMSMANSLEIRSPFLDQEVVHFAFGLPSHYKIDRGMKKKIVQDAFRKHLPGEIYNRPKKGFEIPLLDWFRKELWGLINDDLLNDRFVEEQQIFDGDRVRQLKQQLHSSNPGDSHATVWALLVFQHWWKRYMAG